MTQRERKSIADLIDNESSHLWKRSTLKVRLHIKVHIRLLHKHTFKVRLHIKVHIRLLHKHMLKVRLHIKVHTISYCLNTPSM